jgi:hypothetical protein
MPRTRSPQSWSLVIVFIFLLNRYTEGEAAFAHPGEGHEAMDEEGGWVPYVQSLRQSAMAIATEATGFVSAPPHAPAAGGGGRHDADMQIEDSETRAANDRDWIGQVLGISRSGYIRVRWHSGHITMVSEDCVERLEDTFCSAPTNARAHTHTHRERERERHTHTCSFPLPYVVRMCRRNQRLWQLLALHYSPHSYGPHILMLWVQQHVAGVAV